ncbi:mitochondrial carrier domain-containing protein [Colletotrichum phormii]|uniref:Mitochondrial carrier domain-containing protein n=1 Tax=Colletotrichum phormii TaxID=359342 RepID=A0AAI9ZWA9_9PEZI|nr:mitochondrial carrier domain-containing protein [Colletotrichum phormii]KAK1639343.1 mitochondrial carrier domain-containing protein [Colletotrichum phormii]
MSTTNNPPSFTTALLAGGIAGTTVDLTLFPLDTLKTRLQSSAGFFPSGGFTGIYRGIGSAVVGSAPGAAFFFCTYEGSKSFINSRLLALSGSSSSSSASGSSSSPKPAWIDPATHMLAASLGEIAACAIRVPTEVVKQRAQAGQHGGSSLLAFRSILSQYSSPGGGASAVWRELYRGWSITVLREVPFTIIQFPLWERLKRWGRERKQAKNYKLDIDPQTGANTQKQTEYEVSAVESALYGSVAGAAAAGITTPLDVLKTRVMLSQQKEKIGDILRTIYKEHGIRPFFAGIGPRVMWISIGGSIFLGSYQFASNTLTGAVI